MSGSTTCFEKIGFAVIPGIVLLTGGCFSGGGITSTPSVTVPAANVDVPVIFSPASTPYFSNESTLTISGNCTTGDTLYITGSTMTRTECVNAAFSVVVSASIDGIYTYIINQIAAGGGLSDPTVVVWNRKSSVSPPHVITPTATTYASAGSTLTITGNCESTATIALTGDADGSVVCTNSAFTFNVPKASDGDYAIGLRQTDLAGNTATTSLIWRKHALVATPANPEIVAATEQPMTLSGGSGAYTVTFPSNNSGGHFDASSLTYTAGTVANVTDSLLITDSDGATLTVNVAVKAGAPDHFVLPAGSGVSQIGTVGHTLAQPLVAQVVDPYGNAIPNFNVRFQVINGDAVIYTPPIQTSDANGKVSASVRLGYSNLTNTISIRPSTGTLPDLAGSGNAALTVGEIGSTVGGSGFGDKYPVGSNPGPTVIGDFNGDGIKDIAILNVSEPTVGLMIGRSGGLYGTMSRTYSICSGPNEMASGDFNGDGKLDLVVVCSGSDKFTALLGMGDGTFQTPTSYSTGANESIPATVLVGDFDKDGKQDLAIVSSGGGVVGIWKGTGIGTFNMTGEYAIGLAPSAIAEADLNADGYADLVVANAADNSISVLINLKDGTFDTQVTYGTDTTPNALAVADFNGDGYDDIAVVNNTSSDVTVFLNDTSGVLQIQSTPPVGTSPTAIAVADFTGDGKMDLVITNSGDSSFSLLVGAGDGTFASENAINSTTNPVYISVADLNNDGHPDVVITGNTDQVVQVLLNRGDGGFGLSTATGLSPAAVASADFDGDGYPDAAVANSAANTISVFRGSGTGFLTTMTTLTTGANPSALAAADLNLDGYMDLVVTNQTPGTVGIYYGNGDGTFQPVSNYGVGSSPTGVVVNLFNDDILPDITVVNSSSGTVSVLLNKGDGTFYPKVDYHVGSGPVALIAADFNNDQVMDIATANQSAASVSVMIGNGDGTFQSSMDYLVGDGPSSLVAADFNSDGYADLAVANTVSGSVSILNGLGDGAFATHRDFSAGNTPNMIVAGDFNGDGTLDLALANGYDQSMTWLKGTGASFGASTNIPTGYATPSIGLCDINRDGTLDLLLLDTTSDAVHVWVGH